MARKKAAEEKGSTCLDSEKVRVNTLAETRMRVLCDACAAKAYPEAFNITAQV